MKIYLTIILATGIIRGCAKVYTRDEIAEVIADLIVVVAYIVGIVFVWQL